MPNIYDDFTAAFPKCEYPSGRLTRKALARAIAVREHYHIAADKVEDVDLSMGHVVIKGDKFSITAKLDDSDGRFGNIHWDTPA